MGVITRTLNTRNQTHMAALPVIAEWAKPHCVAPPIDRDGHLRHLLGAVAIDKDSGEVCGYGGIKRRWSDRVVEFGGLVVADSHQGLGAASAITRHVLDDWRWDHPDGAPKVIAFANQHSVGLFTRLGGVIMAQTPTKWDYIDVQPDGPITVPPGPILPASYKNLALDLSNIS